jgi:hypothetical protein
VGLAVEVEHRAAEERAPELDVGRGQVELVVELEGAPLKADHRAGPRVPERGLDGVVVAVGVPARGEHGGAVREAVVGTPANEQASEDEAHPTILD